MCKCDENKEHPEGSNSVRYLNDYIKEVNNAESKVTEQFERNLLTLCSGALALSLTVVTKNANNPCLSFLYLSWIAFGITISLSISSYHVNIKGMNWQLEKTKEYYTSNNENYPDLKNNPFVIVLKVMSRASTISFLLGLLFTALFIKSGIN